jgi:23S rRNA G2069 N7-methylase RlmK/C1962 C5-methylase RlmI
METLERAWAWREKRGLFRASECLRVFHGPGEGKGELSRLAVEKFGDHYWITLWEKVSPATLGVIREFLVSRKALSAVTLLRPDKGAPGEPEPLLGEPPNFFDVSEGAAKFRIRFRSGSTPLHHPGLFLDHAPLREWLRLKCGGLRVLNTFAYTGSLSVAAGLGGASHVTTLDLSKPIVRWAEENWALNELAADRARFIAGDVFERLPRLARQGEKFDLVILDPPSFSRGVKGAFSTAKDLTRLHELAMAVLDEGGYLVSQVRDGSWEGGGAGEDAL